MSGSKYTCVALNKNNTPENVAMQLPSPSEKVPNQREEERKLLLSDNITGNIDIKDTINDIVQKLQLKFGSKNEFSNSMLLQM